LKSIYGVQVRVQINPFIKAANISEKMLAPEWNNDFTNQHGADIRGGYPYRQPTGWVGYGINVLGKYDNRDNSWLAMDKKPGEWAIAYHGVRSDPINVLGKIMNPYGQNKQNPCLLPGNGQACAGQANGNPKTCHMHPTIPVGIYCTPNVQTAEGYTKSVSVGSKNYKLALMLRVRPESITHPSGSDYWVIGTPADVRPYRILIKEC